MTSIKSGRPYKITNVEARYVVDLSTFDNRTIIGYHDRGRDNQKWWVEPYYRGDLQCQWAIRSVSTDKYLGFEGAPSNGTHIVAVDNPQPWALYSPDVMDHTKFGIRLVGTPFVVHWPRGNRDAGTQLLTWASTNENHQFWKFEEV
ncbi:carbohydrate-binding module family 13 protein [Lactifluus subvellereus]|nr:carbohydrate-binding module family 13 protein [Lactifluus subvellereus]